MPVAMNCAPSFDMVRPNVSPSSSINVTSFKSTTHRRLASARWLFLQLLLSSPTHNQTKRPCWIHFSSAGVSVLVILNTSIAFVASSRSTSDNGSPLAALPGNGNYFASGSQSLPAPPVGAFRMRTSVPPRVKQTSSIYAFISWMPYPCAPPGSDARPFRTTFSKSNPFP
jgi:hypothetical protein